jgi:hypothetical protein
LFLSFFIAGIANLQTRTAPLHQRQTRHHHQIRAPDYPRIFIFWWSRCGRWLRSRRRWRWWKSRIVCASSTSKSKKNQHCAAALAQIVFRVPDHKTILMPPALLELVCYLNNFRRHDSWH